MVLGLTTWFSASAVLKELLQSYVVGDELGSLLLIGVQLGFALGAVCSALWSLADVIQIRYLAAVGCVLAAFFNALLLIGSSLTFWGAVATRAATGASLALVYPPLMKLVATHFQVNRSRALGAMVGALTLGSAMPYAVSALGSARATVVVSATSSMTLLSAVLLVLLAKDGPYAFSKSVVDFRQVFLIFRNRGVALAIFAYVMHMVELYAAWSWIFQFMTGVFPRDSDAAWAAFSMVAVGALSSFIAGIVSDRSSRTLVTGGVMLISSLAAFSIGFLRKHPLLAVLVSLIWGSFVIADSAQFSAIVIDLADQKYIGTALTVQLAVGFVLSSLTIYLVPVLVDEFTFTYAFIFLGIGPVFGAMAMFVLRQLPEAQHINNGRT